MSLEDKLFGIDVLAQNLGLSEDVLYERAAKEQWPVLKEAFVNTPRKTRWTKIYRLSDLPTDIRTAWIQRRIARLNIQLYELKAQRTECIHMLEGTPA